MFLNVGYINSLLELKQDLNIFNSLNLLHVNLNNTSFRKTYFSK